LIRSLGGDSVIELSVRRQLDESRMKILPGVLNIKHKSVAEAEASPNSATRIDTAQAETIAYTFTVADVGRALPAMLAELEAQGIELASLVTHEATLEDVFVSLTGRMLRDG
jgi:ABC-2 type transport system ATP-binding protein